MNLNLLNFQCETRPFLELLNNKKNKTNLTVIKTPSIANARFLVFFEKTIHKVKIINLKKKQIKQSKLKSANFCSKTFFRVAKSFP
jgi:hypothetical protein